MRQLERRRDHHDRIARRDEPARLLAVGGADVDVQLIPLDLLVVLRLARDDAVDAAARGSHLDPLPVGDVRPPAAEPVDRQQPVVRDVRDREADHVEMREQREHGPVAAAAAGDQVPDRVRLDLGHVGHGLADHVEGEVLVAGRPVSTQELVEERRDHSAAV